MTQVAQMTSSGIEWPHSYYRPNIKASRSASNLICLPSEPAKPLREIINTLDAIDAWPEDWDTYGAKKPSKKAIKEAAKFSEYFYNFIQRHELDWIQPSIAANSDGGIVFEWWSKGRKLAAYIQPDETFYIIAPNPNIEEMEDVDLSFNDKDFRCMWESLIQ